MCVCAYMCICIHVYVYIYAYMYLCIYACMCIYVYMYVCIDIDTSEEFFFQNVMSAIQTKLASNVIVKFIYFVLEKTFSHMQICI